MVEPDRGVYQWQDLASDEYKVQLKVEIEHKMSHRSKINLISPTRQAYKEFETQTNNLDSYNSTRPVSETLSDWMHLMTL